jgi:hypothetical protein
MGAESAPVAQTADLAKKRQPACRVGVGEAGQKEPPEQAGKHAHWQEELGPAVHPVCTVERDSAGGHDHVDAGAGSLSSPAVEHSEGADARG